MAKGPVALPLRVGRAAAVRKVRLGAISGAAARVTGRLVVADTPILAVAFLCVAVGRLAPPARLAASAPATEMVGQRERGLVEAMRPRYLPGN